MRTKYLHFWKLEDRSESSNVSLSLPIFIWRYLSHFLNWCCGFWEIFCFESASAQVSQKFICLEFLIAIPDSESAASWIMFLGLRWSSCLCHVSKILNIGLFFLTLSSGSALALDLVSMLRSALSSALVEIFAFHDLTAAIL